MRRSIAALALGMLAVLATQASSKAQGRNARPKASEVQLEVLSPWAEVDPIPLRGISPRIANLSGKKIGLFVNSKRAALPIAESIERRLRAMYPDAHITMFRSTQPNVNEIETRNKERFAAWVKGLDAAIAVVGD